MLRRKEKNITSLVLCDYQTTHIGLLIDDALCATVSLSNHQSNQQFILSLDQLLKTNDCSLCDCSAIGLYRGPAPFTTLRNIVASVNALAWASGLPIHAAHGVKLMLWSLAKQVDLQQNQAVCVALYAFGQDVYYGWFTDYAYTWSEQHVNVGFCSKDEFIEKFRLKCSMHERVVIAGNAWEKFDICAIAHEMGAEILDPFVTVPTIQMLAHAIVEHDAHKLDDVIQTVPFCQPLYLKEISL
ncbi:MAG: hypothetical protein UU47_C0004G0006 [candidate division TM6 bacterium GW2011_GWE2_41_16]|nr:MAG: hypothetical protein UU47_C0004G0006 [candidate division TM6 bacterium GW2011_GWE2_41_16]